MMSKRIDLTGEKFDRLKVISYVGTNKNGQALWQCECKCGKKIVTKGKYLRNGDTKSCGCLVKEVASKRMNERNTKHGKRNTRLYAIWHGMKQRTQEKTNKAYEKYGGRGIKLCEEWNDFNKFEKWALENGYMHSLTLDRKDNDGDYCPQNCRWTTYKTQANNRSNNVVIEYNGETKTVSQWAEEKGLRSDTLRSRLNRGWDITNALETPVQGKMQGTNRIKK